MDGPSPLPPFRLSFMSSVSPASRQSIIDHIFSNLFQWNNNWYLDMDFASMRPINCGFRCLKGSLCFLEVVPSIVNPVNKLYSLAYKVQQTFFVPAKKNPCISEQHDTSFLLTKYHSYWNVFYLVKMRNLSLASIWSLRSLRKKSSAIAAIIAVITKPLSSDRSDRSDNDHWDRIFSISAVVKGHQTRI